jgi:hypothetical protein
MTLTPNTRTPEVTQDNRRLFHVGQDETRRGVGITTVVHSTRTVASC